MESRFIYIRNLKTRSNEIYWKSTHIDSHKMLVKIYRSENPTEKIQIMGGGKLHMDLDRKLVILFGTSSGVGQFNMEDIYQTAKIKFQGWNVVANPWTDNTVDAIKGWVNCDFKFQIYRMIHDKAVYSVVLKNGTTIDKVIPSQGSFIVTSNEDQEIHKIGSFIPVESVHEIKRLNHHISGS